MSRAELDDLRKVGHPFAIYVVVITGRGIIAENKTWIKSRA
jgi:hypothetical protein